MARMIDASRFGEILEQWKKDCLEDNDIQGADIISDVILQLDDMPTLTQPNDFTPVQHGRWVKPVPGDGENYCSVCHAVQPWFYGYGYYDSDYCPNCGACMDVKEELKDGKND